MHPNKTTTDKQNKQKRNESETHLTRTARNRLGDEEAAKKHRHSLIVIDQRQTNRGQ